MIIFLEYMTFGKEFVKTVFICESKVLKIHLTHL